MPALAHDFKTLGTSEIEAQDKKAKRFSRTRAQDMSAQSTQKLDSKKLAQTWQLEKAKPSPKKGASSSAKKQTKQQDKASFSQSVLQSLGHQAWLYGLLSFALVSLFLVASLMYQQIGDRFFIDAVKVNGEFDYLKEEELQSVLSGALYKKRFFEISSSEIAEQVGDIACVDAVEVRKKWPGTLLVNVSEKTPVARWNDKQVISHRGLVFSPSNTDALHGLPLLEGPQGKTEEIMQFYHHVSSLFHFLKWQIASLSYVQRGEWHIVTKQGAEIRLMQDDALLQIKRLVYLHQTASQSVVNLLNNGKRFDLRYPNSVAVYKDSVS